MVTMIMRTLSVSALLLTNTLDAPPNAAVTNTHLTCFTSNVQREVIANVAKSEFAVGPASI